MFAAERSADVPHVYLLSASLADAGESPTARVCRDPSRCDVGRARGPRMRRDLPTLRATRRRPLLPASIRQGDGIGSRPKEASSSVTLQFNEQCCGPIEVLLKAALTSSTIPNLSKGSKAHTQLLVTNSSVVDRTFFERERDEFGRMNSALSVAE